MIYFLMSGSALQRLIMSATQPPVLEAHMDTFVATTQVLPVLRDTNIAFETCGEDLIATNYSATLIELVHRCLAFNTVERPALGYIKRECQVALAAIDAENEANGKFGILELGHYYNGDEPTSGIITLPPGFAPFTAVVKAGHVQPQAVAKTPTAQFQGSRIYFQLRIY